MMTSSSSGEPMTHSFLNNIQVEELSEFEAMEAMNEIYDWEQCIESDSYEWSGVIDEDDSNSTSD